MSGAKALLSPLDLRDVLELCALLNAVNQITSYEAGGWKSAGGEELIERLLRDLLEPVHHQRARNISQTAMPFSPLVGVAITGVIGLACRWCQKENGKPLRNIRFRRNVTRVLFALQGELLDKTKTAQVGKDEGLRRAFPYVARSILANKAVNMAHDLGRLHALVSRPEIGKVLGKKENHSVDDWFNEKIGLPVSQYQRLMSALAGYAGQFKANNPRPGHLWLDLDAFVTAVGCSSRAVWALLRSAETEPERLVSDTPEPRDLADAVYGLDHLLVRPLLRVGNHHLVTSFEAVFAKFLRGFTYLSTSVAQQKAGKSNLDLAKGTRGGFGPIFEGYVCWLAHQWFKGAEVEVIDDYRTIPPGIKKGEKPPQGDLLLVHDNVGYAIEVKAIVPPTEMRKSGELDLFVKKLVPQKDGSPDQSGLVLQVRRLAKGLVAGSGVRSDGNPIPALKQVFSIGVVFELPLQYPFTNPLESDIERACGEEAFQHSDGVAPFQLFEIETFEDLDEVFAMPSEAAAVLSALQKRANTGAFRYEKFEAVRGSRRKNCREKPGLLQLLADESEAFVKSNCKSLQPTSTTDA